MNSPRRALGSSVRTSGAVSRPWWTRPSDTCWSASVHSLEALRESAVEACWRQWTTLGASLSRTRGKTARSVVDLEALVLTSLALVTDERRLGDAVAWWAGTASRLVSVQRLRTMARRGPAAAEDLVATFAATASAAGD